MRINIINKNNLEIINILNDAGLEVALTNLGASIYSIKFNNEVMTMTPIVLSEFQRFDLYYGKTIGRVAGRIKDSTFIVDGKTYHTLPNEGTNTLHSGDTALFTRNFKSEVKELDYGVEVTYSYLSPDMECGFPGNADIKVIYLIHKEQPILDVKFEVNVDKTCPISLTNHSYFCLAEKSLKDCKLMIKADKFIEVDPNERTSICEKEVPSFMNFNEFKPILEDINEPYLMESATKGYDHYFIFNKDHDQISLKGNRYQLDIDTNMDGTQIYTHNYMDNVITMSSGALQYRGIAIEPQLNPLSDINLKPNDIFMKYITYTFKKLA